MESASLTTRKSADSQGMLIDRGMPALTRKRALDGQRDRQNRHERLVGHGVDDGADDSPQVPPARDPAVEQIRDARPREQAGRPPVLVVQDAVADDWRGRQPREGEEVRDRVDVLVPRRRPAWRGVVRGSA